MAQPQESKGGAWPPPQKANKPKWDGTSFRQDLKGKGDDYGCPEKGTKSEARGFKAGDNINKEICELCEIIIGLGQELPDGTYAIRFKELFEAYTRISNKLVGMLMRARKHGLVEFEGEMLFQRRDDHVVIRLVDLPPQMVADADDGGEGNILDHLRAVRNKWL